MKQLREFLLLALLSVSLLMLTSCQSSMNDPALKQGFRAFRKMTAPVYLQKSAFYVAYPNGSPSDYVSFLFSDIGAAEWPPVEGSGEFPEAEEIRGIAAPPIMPKNVAFLPNQPDPKYMGKQIVVKADNARGLLILEAYEKPTEEPVAIEEVALIKVEPDPLAKLTYQSAHDLGASDARQDRGIRHVQFE